MVDTAGLECMGFEEVIGLNRESLVEHSDTSNHVVENPSELNIQQHHDLSLEDQHLHPAQEPQQTTDAIPRRQRPFSPDNSQQEQQHPLQDQHLHHEHEPQLIRHTTQHLLAPLKPASSQEEHQPDSAEILSIDKETSLNPGTVTENSLASTEISLNMVEDTSEPHELEEQKIDGVTQLYPLAPPKQQLSLEQSQQQQTCLADGVTSTQDTEADEISAELVHTDVINTESLRESKDLFTKLNSGAEEFVPLAASATLSSDASTSTGGVWRKIGYNSNLNPFADQFVPLSRCDRGERGKKKRANNQRNRTQQEDCIRRTVYVTHIAHQVTEEYLADLFQTVGQVVDCRIWGDQKSPLRFGFLEFTEEAGASAALRFAESMLYYSASPIRFWPSKTAIVPVNPVFLPQSEDERERCGRTIYCKNIDQRLSEADVRLLFQVFCGKIAHLRLLGNCYNSTQIAFVEFVTGESASAALNCSGAIFGSLPIRVTPSKTPVMFPSVSPRFL